MSGLADRPTCFGIVEESGGKLRAVIKMSVPAETATTPSSPAGRLGWTVEARKDPP